MSRGQDERYGEKHFPNGDVYIGCFDGPLPHGQGKYTWPDGATYEGEWNDGKIAGKGSFSWPSNSLYEGEFCGIFLHGFGTLSTLDGTAYNGDWRMNAQHGLGTKSYANSDVYMGFWREGQQEGIGKYTWNNGSIYVGNWKEGKMNGRGVLKWANGDLFNGNWLDGLEHGTGFYYFADGSCFNGTWSKGLKDGWGVYYPVGSRVPFQRKCYEYNFCSELTKRLCPSALLKPPDDQSELISSRFKIRNLFWHSGCIFNKSTVLDGFCNFGDSFGNSLLKDVCFTLSCPSHKGHIKLQCCNNTAYEREYTQGVLKMERIVNRHLLMPERNKRLNKIKKRTVGDHGETIYKGHRSYYLMLNLQLGIRYTVGKITSIPVREVSSSDFGPCARIMMHFPRNGSQFTPPHHSIGFNWMDYCPMVFRNLREMFKIDAADYMVSVCGGDGLKKLSSPGKSGSIFYLSQDERFVIKTLRKVELKGLLKMLPKYYDHVGAHENTLITKFFGLHRITIKFAQKVRFVVMGNMFCTELHIHRRYDLKGSSHGRSTSPKKINYHSTLKDLDLPYVFHLEKSWRESLFRQISLDCKFLESQSIIDYSLLLGVHFRAPEILRPPLQSESINECPSLANDNNFGAQTHDVLQLQKALCLVAHEPGSVRSMPGSHMRGSTLRASAHSDEEREVDLLLPGAGRLRVQLGVNMPAKAIKMLHIDAPDYSEADLLDSYGVVLYLGIIDILQDYNIIKKVEHKFKSLNHNSITISAIEPKLYSQRFISFLEKVFP